jgi:hypothetical protein
LPAADEADADGHTKSSIRQLSRCREGLQLRRLPSGRRKRDGGAVITIDSRSARS